MKKIISIILACVLCAAMTVSAFAATADTTLTFDISVDGEHDITVKTGDVITVTYLISASSSAETITTQNQIYYDHTFFELVSGSNKIADSLRGYYTTRLILDSDARQTHYIYYNTSTTITYPTAGMEIGTFQLKVLATSGSSTVQNTANFANDSSLVHFGSAKNDLKVTVNGTGGGGGGAGGGGGGTVEPVVPPEPADDGDSVCPKDSTCPLSGFTDLTVKAWYHDGIHYCLEHGIMNGTGNALFEPNGTATRAQIARVLYNLEGQPALMNDSIFSDVVPGSWYEKAVVWAQGRGVVKGYGNGMFGPADPITREQMAVILYNYAKFKGIDVTVDANTNFLSFNDFWDISEWAKPAMTWAIDREIIVGSDNNLDPQGKAGRAQIATIIWRYCENILQ